MPEQSAREEMGRYLEVWNGFLTVCGLSCVAKVDHPDGSTRFEVSRWKYAIPIVIISLLCYLVLILASGLTMQTNHGETMVSGYLNLTGNMVAAVSILLSMLSSHAYARIKIQFSTFDELVTIDYKTLTKGIFKYAAFFITVYVFSFITDFLQYQQDTSSAPALKILSSYIFQLYNLLSILHFSVCLFWLRKSFALINVDLLSQANMTNAWSKKQDPHKMFHHNITHPEFSFEFIRLRACDGEETGASAVKRLRFLRTLYHAAYELAHDVNGVFGTRNVVSVGYNFVVGTIFMYSGISELVRRSSGTSDASTLELLAHFKWSFISFLSIYGLVWPCTSTCDEAKKTAVIVQGLLTKSLHEEMREELQSTSFQFIHEQVSFSPHGFFFLNNNLLLSIMGAVVSYLVVLIQFRINMG